MDGLSAFLVSIASILAAFTAGWIVATDKNRNELFKQKIESYKKLSTQVSRVFAIGVELENIEDPSDVHKSETVLLLNMLFTESLFLPKDITIKIYKFIVMKPKDYKDNKEEIAEITGELRADLRIDRLNLINKITSLEFDKQLLFEMLHIPKK